MDILFDIGATKMRVASSRDGKSFEARSVRIVPTPDSFVEGMGMFQKLALELAHGKSIRAVAGGVAGSLDRKKGILFNPPNLPDWKEKPIKKTIAALLDTKKVFIENDTALVGLGEAINGAGKNYRIVVYVTVSTGVNGVRVVEKALDQSAWGFEIGHQIIGGEPEKTLEYYVGAASLAEHFGKPVRAIKDREAWDIITERLAQGLHNTILHWSPDVLILGGGTVRAGHIKIPEVKEHLANIHHVFPRLPEIKKAALGDLGGLWGALAFLRQQLKKKQKAPEH